MPESGFPYLWTFPVPADAGAILDPISMEQGNQFADDHVRTLGQNMTRASRSFAWGVISRLSGYTIEKTVWNLVDDRLKQELLDFGMACYQAGRLIERHAHDTK